MSANLITFAHFSLSAASEQGVAVFVGRQEVFHDRQG
jgi:hypothetical protein